MKKKKSSNVECLHTSASNWCITALNERHSLNMAWKLNITHCFHISKRWFGFWHTSWCPHSLHTHTSSNGKELDKFMFVHICATNKAWDAIFLPNFLFIRVHIWKATRCQKKEEKSRKTMLSLHLYLSTRRHTLEIHVSSGVKLWQPYHIGHEISLLLVFVAWCYARECVQHSPA